MGARKSGTAAVSTVDGRGTAVTVATQTKERRGAAGTAFGGWFQVQTNRPAVPASER